MMLLFNSFPSFAAWSIVLFGAGGWLVNRDTIIQTEDTGSSPYVGKHLSY